MDIYGDMNPGDLNDTLVGTDDPDSVYGGQGDDSLDGAGGADSLDGGIGNDTITAGPSDDVDTLVGGDGDDLYIVHGSAPTIVETAGGGTDTIQSDADYLNLNAYANVENGALTGAGSSSEIDGNALDNVLSTSDLANYGYLYGGDGADSLYLNEIVSGYAYGGNGADSIAAYGSDGAAAQIYGDAGADTLDAEEARGSTSLYGGDDGDRLIGSGNADLLDGGAGADTITTGAGVDTISLHDFDGAVDEITDFAVAPFGVSADRDVLDISALLYSFSNYIYGDNPFTGDNPHLQFVQDGADTVLQIRPDGTGAWQDYVRLDGVTASDLISDNLSPNFAPFGNESSGSGGDDGDNYLQGSALPDALYAYGGNDTLDGGFEADSLYGGDGNDVFLDGYGENQIFGGADNDVVYNLGDDLHDQTVYGGSGSDTFAFDGAGAGHVLIGDFEAGPGGDVLDLQSVIYSLQDYDGGNPFVEGRLVFTTDGADSVLSADIFGNGTLSEVTRLANFDWHALTADNFAPGYSLDGHGASFVGTPDPDSYYGGVNDDTITGAASSDSLYGGDGNDSVDGGADDDFVYGGAGADTVYGGDDNDVVDGGAGADTLTGGGGDDLYFVDNAGDVVVELPGGGVDTVKASVSTTLSANVEKLVLTASGQTGTGNDGANLISGTSGMDTLDGGLNTGPAGDTLQGGGGDDTYIVRNASDVVQETAGAGSDTIRTSLAVYSLASALNVENLVYTGAADFTGTGNALANAVTGGGGNDTLDGGAGADTLTGGGGNDSYYVDSAGDQVVEAAGGGSDTVYVANSAFVLGAGQAVETLVAAGVLGVALHGNELANHLIGNGAANLMDGGAGADTMEGGAGSDTYLVDDVGDQVIEGVGAGSDTVKTTLGAYTLTANVEALTFTGAGDFAGTGNGSDNTLVGGVGNDTLDGSTGADRLVGQIGNDVYYVDGTGDVVLENAGEGTDTVHTTLSTYVLPANVEVLHYDGTGAFNGTGNALDNTLYADASAAATLHGAGGNDTLYGGSGNDSLYGEGGSDVVYGGGGDDYFRTLTGQGPDTIDGGTGTDLLTLERTDATVQLTVDLTLSGVQAVGEGSQFSGIEQIRFAGGSGADFGRGGDLDDVLKGMGGADTLIGGGGNDILQGGTGHDSLTGGLGVDTFRFDGPIAGSDDTVTDFVSGTDKVALSHAGFGVASLSDFDIVAAAGGPTEGKATLIVNTVAHTLSWDADGTGAGAATLLAHGAFTTNAGDYLVF